MEQRITMQQVLALINQYDDDGNARVFSLKYVKADGSVGFKAKCCKAGKHKPKSEEHTPFHFNLKEKGVVMIQAEGEDRPKFITKGLMTHFNGIRIFH